MDVEVSVVLSVFLISSVRGDNSISVFRASRTLSLAMKCFLLEWNI